MKLLHALAARFGYRLLATRRPYSTLDEHLQRVLAELGVSCVIDVGANRGQYGRTLRDIGYRGRIVSVEPLASVYAELEAEASGDPDWSTHRMALGARPGTLELHVTRSSQFASFHPPSEYGREHFGRFMPVEAKEEVRVGTLDEEWTRFTEGLTDPVVYLKLDTQGYDLEVLRGAEGVLPRVAALQSELAVQRIYDGMPAYREALEVLHGHGFEPSGFFPITREEGGLPLVEMDCVMVRAKGG